MIHPARVQEYSLQVTRASKKSKGEVKYHNYHQDGSLQTFKNLPDVFWESWLPREDDMDYRKYLNTGFMDNLPNHLWISAGAD